MLLYASHSYNTYCCTECTAATAVVLQQYGYSDTTKGLVSPARGRGGKCMPADSSRFLVACRHHDVTSGQPHEHHARLNTQHCCCCLLVYDKAVNSGSTTETPEKHRILLRRPYDRSLPCLYGEYIAAAAGKAVQHERQSTEQRPDLYLELRIHSTIYFSQTRKPKAASCRRLHSTDAQATLEPRCWCG